MNFLSTGVKEFTRRLRRQKNRLALSNARKALDRADTALGRHAWRELVGQESDDVRPAFDNLHRLNDEVEAAHQRIAELESQVRETEAARESARREHQQAAAAIDHEREPHEERLLELQASLTEHGKTLHDQNVLKNALRAAQTALLKQERSVRRQAILLSDSDRAARQRDLETERIALAEQAGQLAAARSAAVEPMVSDEGSIKGVKATLAALEARAQQARAELTTKERAAALAIAAHNKEIAATRRQAGRVEEEKEDAYLAIGQRLSTHDTPPRGADEPYAASRRHRIHYERLAGLDSFWQQESQNADRQDLRVFHFVNVTVAIVVALVLLLVFRSPGKRDWLPANTAAILAIDVRGFTDADFAHALESQQPDEWQTVWTGLLRTVAQVPQIDVRKQVARITRALAPADAQGPAVDCLLVEMRASVDLDDLLHTQLGKQGGFTSRTTDVDGVSILEKGDIAIAQIGPETLALGSYESVEALIRVRLGLRDDMKSDAPFLNEFQHLESGSVFRLVTYKPRELTSLTETVLNPELLEHCNALGLTLDMREPMSAVFVLNAPDNASAGQVARELQANPDRVLQLQGAYPNLFIEPPSVARTRDNQVEWRFRMTQPAASAFLERVSRLEMATSTDHKVATRNP